MRIPKEIRRWFPIDGDDDGAEIEIRHLEPAEIEDIAAEAMSRETRYEPDPDDPDKIRPVVKAGGFHEQSKAIFCAAVTGWRCFFDDAGGTLDCTDKNKITALKKIEGLGRMVDDYRAKLAEDVANERKALEKN